MSSGKKRKIKMYNPKEQQMVFAESIATMKANYGTDKFPKEKVDLIWNELKEFSPKQIKSVCSFVLANNSYAPTIQPFREFSSMLREKLRQFDREQERRDAHDFWAGSYTPDDKKWIVKMIKDRLAGKVSDEVYNSFKNDLKKIADDSERMANQK